MVASFLCPIDPDEPIRALSDHDMRVLRRHAHGLATAT
jgi:hypothetical protein